MENQTLTVSVDVNAPEKFKSSHRKENAFYREIVAIDPAGTRYADSAHTVVTARLYATDSRAYACVWANGKIAGESVHISGSDFAGGYGYHRPSAALSGALANAGVSLSESISGRGDGAMVDAVRALANALGCDAPLIHTAHA